MGLSRRSFLGVGAGGLAILAVGGTGLGLWPPVPRAPAAPLRALSPRAFSVLAALSDRICPGGEGFPTAAEIGTAEAVDGLLATMEPGTVAEVQQALLLFENALTGLIFDGRPRPFTACSPEEQDAILVTWQTSGLHLRRKVIKALRGLVAAAYYANPAVFPAVGYPGPPNFTAFLAARAEALAQALPDPVEGAAPPVQPPASVEGAP